MVTARVVDFIRFAGLSGIGWLVDVSLLVLLVWAGVPVFFANVVSSTTAALSVFLISRIVIFKGQQTALGARVAIYTLYTLCMILLAATALQEVVVLGAAFLAAHGVAVSSTSMAGIGKVIITPPQLILNFLVARFLSKRELGPRLQHV